MLENRKRYADLHIHTTFSDGTFTPEVVVQKAQKAGLSCIAITDHDEVSGIEPTIRCAVSYNIEIIAGVELTAEVDDYELHILGYCIDWGAEWFRNKLNQICEVRRKRALAILEKLKRKGIILKPEEFLHQTHPGSIGRLHIARMLEGKGLVHSIQEAFNRYIGNGGPCYVKKFKMAPGEAIDMINRLNGIAVLAHPYNIGNDELIPELVELGLKGIEVYYPEHSGTTIEHYRSMAEKYGLLITGGSDCHGPSKDKGMIGGIKVPYKLVEDLKKCPVNEKW